jgi:hypothetical protein
MDVEISITGHLIRKLVLCPTPEPILRPLRLCFIEILINLTIISPPNSWLFSYYALLIVGESKCFIIVSVL